MCGICGFYNYKSSEPADETLVRAMAASIVHRGPDDEGYYIEGAVGLGMRRLSIIDLTGGHQPMCNEDGTVWIVFNGEIYNFQDLRRELEARGHVFRTRSDTETVIHAYEEWGLAALPKLNGMFGFALWDSHHQELILARDPFGIKPVYYSDHGGRLLFGSEIKAILTDPTMPRMVDLAALDDFLTFTFVPSPRTLFKEVEKLPPGTVLRVTRTGLQQQRFHSHNPELQFRSEVEWLEALRAGIEAAIHRQMVADVPVGAMLSGGVDSTTVATLMRRFAGHPIHTFTVGFTGEFAQNELDAARHSAELIGSEHHEAIISAEEYAEFLPRSLWYLEEPIATASALAFYWICRLAREHVKVVLTGQGADEPFAGYGRHLGEYYGSWYRRLPAVVRRGVISPLVERLPRNEQLKRAVRSLSISDPLERLTQVYTIFDSELKRKLYRSGLMNGHAHPATAAVQGWQRDVRHLDGLSQMLHVDARFSLPDNLLMYGDKMSMAVSLEARVPFLDLELMALVESLPPSFKIRGLTQKYLLKRAVAAWIPPEIVRRKKIGFTTPVDRWFSHELHQYIGDQLLSADSACYHYFEPAAIQRLIADHESRRHDYKRHLFSLLTFELWHKQFISNSLGEHIT
jgi:asparagine synthase (glutamine-hydrolysing)